MFLEYKRTAKELSLFSAGANRYYIYKVPISRKQGYVETMVSVKVSNLQSLDDKSSALPHRFVPLTPTHLLRIKTVGL